MEDFLLILMALCGVFSHAYSYNDWGYFPPTLDRRSEKYSGRTYFKNTGFFPSQLAAQKPLPQQLERRSLPSTAYFPDSRDELKLWWDNVVEQQRPYDETDRDFREEPRFNYDGDLTDASKEYMDFFGLSPPAETLNEDEAFRQALKAYLSQDTQNFIPQVKDERSRLVKVQGSLTNPTMMPSSEFMKSPPSTTMSPAPSTMTTRSIAKGQKEFAMLRPPSDNHRQFDKWAKSFQDSVINSAASKIRDTRQVVSDDQFGDDSLLQQLRSLKHKSTKKNAKKTSTPTV